MQRQVVLLTSILITLLLGGQTPSPYQNTLLQHELATLTERGVTYRILDNGWIEVDNPLIGQKELFPTEPLLTPRVPKYSGLPTLTINLTTIDTSLYSWKYHFVNAIPVTGVRGYGLRSADVNGNGRVEVYGIYQSQTQGGTDIYELNPNGNWESRYRYPFQVGVVEKIHDIDHNSLKEAFARNADTLYVFEQSTQNDYPTQTKFRFRVTYAGAIGIPIQLDDMDTDGLDDLVYRGSRPDSITTVYQLNYVAKYDSQTNNFTNVWSAQLPKGCSDAYCASNLSTGDFDGDGKKEFVTSTFNGNAFVVEHVKGDSFCLAWQDSLSVAGRVAGGDVDGNGIDEFFVGGNQPEADGYVHMRIYAYERTGDNMYQPVFAFNIFPVGFFFPDLYQTVDVDGDGRKELLLSFGGGNIVIKGSGVHTYELFYYKGISGADGFSAGDIDGDGIPELFMSSFLNDGQGLFTHTYVYRLDSTLVGVKEDGVLNPAELNLHDNYPNPFNPTTTIKYDLPVDSRVTLKIFSILGKEVRTIVDEVQSAGYKSLEWNSKNNAGLGVASGVYFYRIEATSVSDKEKSFTQMKKMLLLK